MNLVRNGDASVLVKIENMLSEPPPVRGSDRTDAVTLCRVITELSSERIMVYVDLPAKCTFGKYG